MEQLEGNIWWSETAGGEYMAECETMCCEFLVSHSGVAVDSVPLACEAVWLGVRFPTFRMIAWV